MAAAREASREHSTGVARELSHDTVAFEIPQHGGSRFVSHRDRDQAPTWGHAQRPHAGGSLELCEDCVTLRVDDPQSATRIDRHDSNIAEEPRDVDAMGRRWQRERLAIIPRHEQRAVDGTADDTVPGGGKGDCVDRCTVRDRANEVGARQRIDLHGIAARDGGAITRGGHRWKCSIVVTADRRYRRQLGQ